MYSYHKTVVTLTCHCVVNSLHSSNAMLNGIITQSAEVWYVNWINWLEVHDAIYITDIPACDSVSQVVLATAALQVMDPDLCVSNNWQC